MEIYRDLSGAGDNEGRSPGVRDVVAFNDNVAVVMEGRRIR